MKFHTQLDSSLPVELNVNLSQLLRHRKRPGRVSRVQPMFEDFATEGSRVLKR